MTNKLMQLATLLTVALITSAAPAQEESQTSSAWIRTDPLETLCRPLDQLRKHAAPSGLEFELGLTGIFQGASDTVDGQSATMAGFSYDFVGMWTLFENQSLGAGGFGWHLEGGRTIGSGRLEDLSARAGSILGINDDLDAEPVALTELWWSQNLLEDKLIITTGKIDQTCYFDTNRIANSETDQFIATPLVNNLSIPFPDNGLGLNVTTQPGDTFFFSGGFGDANAVATETGFDTFDQHEYFAAVEAGLMPHFENLGDGTYRLTLWRNEIDGRTGYGWALSFDQEIAPDSGVVPFFRYGSADDDVSDFEQFISGGLGFEGCFGRADDLLAIGCAWADPSDDSVAQETIVEAFYRAQLSDSVQLTPDLQVIFNPADNPAHDVIVVGGLRVQIVF